MAMRARAFGRVVTMDGSLMTVQLSWPASLLRRRRDRTGRPIPRSVTFNAAGLSYRHRQPSRWLCGRLMFRAPVPCPWSRSGRYVLRYGRRSARSFTALVWAMSWAAMPYETPGHRSRR
jgi:hypothetical protein